MLSYDRAAALKKDSDETIMKSLLNEFGNESYNNALTSFASINYRLPQSQMSKEFETAIYDANTAVKVETNPWLRIQRAKKAIENFNKNISKCTATLRNSKGFFEILSPEELKALEVAVPLKKKANDEQYVAWGSVKRRLAR